MTPLFAVEHDGQTYAMTPQTLVQELTYSSYRYNRLLNPTTPPAHYAVVFPHWEQLEQRFQKDILDTPLESPAP